MNADQLVHQTYYYAGVVGIRLANWESFLARMHELNDHNAKHFEHSLRVGIYAHRVAWTLGYIDNKFALYAGCGHDIGKCEISNDVLNAQDFGPEEMAQVKAHAQHGYEMLKDTNLFTALVAGLHHKFQPDGYGIDLDDIPSLTGVMKMKVERMAKLVMVCDFFDAVTTRKGRFEGQDVTDLMLGFFPDHRNVITWLVEHQIK